MHAEAKKIDWFTSSNEKGNTDYAMSGQCVPKHLFPLNTKRCCGGAV